MKRVLMLLCAAGLIFAQGPKRAPSFCLSDTTGQWHDLVDYRGKVVIIEFMQTTCPNCAAFTPKLIALQQKYGSKLQVLAVALPQDTPNTMLEYVKGHKLNYPLLFDMGQVAASYVRGPNLHLPTVYLVDGQGMLRGNWEEGPLAKDIFEGNGLATQIDKLLLPPAAKK
jgi:peroxiredoxin